MAADLGTSNIKASVLNKSNRPVRLVYPMGDYETTLLSSVVAVTGNEKVVIGDFASLLGISDPGMKIYDWLHSSHKSLIASAFLGTIKHASIKHYSDPDIGIVLLYNNNNDIDQELVSIAETFFCKVETMQIGEVIKRIISPDSNLMLIADFGGSAFRITIQGKSKYQYQKSNNNLGFLSFDMLSLIDYNESLFHSSIEIALLGQMMQRIKILKNRGENIILPQNLSIKGNSLANTFKQKMTEYLYKCFEECTNGLKDISKSWNDIEELVFIGGGAHSNIINTVFEKYMQSHCSLIPYNSHNQEFDAQFAASHCAIQIPHRASTNVVIKF